MAATEISPVELEVTILVTVTVGAGGVLSFSGEHVGPDGTINIENVPQATSSIKFKLADDPISAKYSFPNGIILTVRDGNNDYCGLKREVILKNVRKHAGIAYFSMSVFNRETGTRISQDPGLRNP